jgi:hypothetical protein
LNKNDDNLLIKIQKSNELLNVENCDSNIDNNLAADNQNNLKFLRNKRSKTETHNNVDSIDPESTNSSTEFQRNTPNKIDSGLVNKNIKLNETANQQLKNKSEYNMNMRRIKIFNENEEINEEFIGVYLRNDTKQDKIESSLSENFTKALDRNILNNCIVSFYYF